jgi:trigger factor
MVSTELEKLSSCRIQIQITMSAENIDSIRKDQEKIVQRDVQIQGFRKGKAPLGLIKKTYAGLIERNTLDEAMQRAFETSLKDNDIHPVGQPLVKSFDFDNEKNLKMEVEVEVYPEIPLKKYKNFTFEKNIYTIDDTDVDENIDYILKQKAVITPIEGESNKGNFVSFSVQEIDASGMPLIGKKYDDIRIQLGEGQFDPEIEDQIIGMKSGEERRIEKRYPKSAGKELAGKVERFNITMQKVEKEELPELDDQFVQQLNFDIKTVDDLRKKVRDELEHRWGQESEHQFYHNVVQELLHENPFDVPEVMVNNYLDRILEDIRKKDKNIEEEEVRKRYRADAMFNIKWFHLREKIAKDENIKTTDDDFKTFLDSIEDENVRKMYESNKELKQAVLNDIFEKKVFDFLISNSKVKEKKKSIKQRKELLNV